MPDHFTGSALAVSLVLALAGAHAAQAAGPNPCDPRTYGATGDGVTDDTQAIQLAIDTCAAQGGGTVPFDHGTFVTGPFTLHGHIFVRVSADATILGTTDQSRYVPAYIGAPYRSGEALISTSGATDVALFGAGTIDGQGDVDPPGGQSWYSLAGSATFPYASFPFAPSSNGLPRPWLVEFWMTDHVVVQGVHLARSPMWTLVPRYASDVTIVGISDSAPSTSKNTDAVDVVSSQDVAISNVAFASGDDDVALKSGLPSTFQDPAQPLPPAPTQFVTVANATFTSGHGMSIGSEAINGVHDIDIENVSLANTSNGFRIKTGRDRGSEIRDISATNLMMTNVDQPIVINSYYPASSPPKCGTDTQPQPVTATTPYISNVTLTNIVAVGATKLSFISGLAESPALDIDLSNVNIGQASSKVPPMDLRFMTGAFSNVAVSPTSTGTNFGCNESVQVTGEILP